MAPIQTSNLGTVAKKLGATAVAGAATVPTVAKDVMKETLADAVKSVNPVTYVKMMASQLSDAIGLNRISTTFNDIYGALIDQQKEEKKSTKIFEEQTSKVEDQTSILNLILDVLLEQYKVQIKNFRGESRSEAIDKFTELEEKREGIKGPKIKKPNVPIMEETPWMRFIGMFGAIPGWLIGGIGIAASGTVAGLASFLGFDEILVVWSQTIKIVQGAASSVVSSIKALSSKAITGPIKGIKKSTSKILGIFKPIVGVIEGLLVSAKGFSKFIGGPFVMSFLALFDFGDGFIKGFKEGGTVEGLKQGLYKVFEGFVLAPLDLVKDILAWTTTKFGFKNFSDKLDSFSITERVGVFISNFNKLASDIVNEILDIDYAKYYNDFIKFISDHTIKLEDTSTKLNNTSHVGIDQIYDHIQTMVDEIMSIPEKVVNSILETLRLEKAVDYLGDFSVKNMYIEIVDTIKNFFTDFIKSLKKSIIETSWSIWNWNSADTNLSPEEKSQNPYSPEILSAAPIVNNTTRNVIKKSSDVNHYNRSDLANIHVDNRNQSTTNVSGGNSQGNASRNVPVNTTPRKSPWEIREGSNSGYGGGW